MKIRPFILHHHKISELPAQEDSFRTKPWRHWGYPEVNLLYLPFIGFLQGLHKFFFVSTDKNCCPPLKARFLPWEYQGCALPCCQLAAPKPCYAVAEWLCSLFSQRLLQELSWTHGCSFPQSKIKQRCWSVVSYLPWGDTGPGSPRAQDSS